MENNEENPSFNRINDQLEDTLGEIMELKKVVEQETTEKQMDSFGHHLHGECDEAYEGLIQRFDSMMNGAYHSSGDLAQKAELLSKFDFQR